VIIHPKTKVLSDEVVVIRHRLTPSRTLGRPQYRNA
jgi:hypothetical protein